MQGEINLPGKAIKICFVAPKAYPIFNPEKGDYFGGAEVDLYLLATELAKDENFAVSFIAADYGQPPVELREGVKIIKSLDFKKNPLIGAVKIWLAMRQADAQIYFQETSSWGTFLVARFCKSYNRKFVYRTAHQNDCDGTYLKQHYFAGKAFRWSLRNAAQIVVQNKNDQKNLKQTIGVNSIVIPNAHHLPVLSQSKRNTILWVGRSAQFKRPELFIDLAEQMPDENFTFVCQRATGDKKYENLVARAKQVNNLQFIKQVAFDEIDNYFQQAKVFICTSKGEGFPNTYIQACKCATPILSLCVNPDNFINTYECGKCANDNWDEFIALLKQMLKPQEIRRYGKNARKYAEQHHDIEKIVENYKIMFSSRLCTMV
jgi:glycosyltransferase involved in cell wall biosynthesis